MIGKLFGNHQNEGVKMRKECSDKITFTNFVLMCFIVLLHADNQEAPDYSSVTLGTGYQLIYQFFHSVTAMAVPIFFALSGYLLFRNCNWDTIGRKIKGRCKSVLIPYLFWNISFYGVYALLNLIPAIGSKINFDIPEITLKVLLLDNYANPPLWFLPKLFLLQLFAPLGLLLFQKLKHFNLIWIGALIIADIIYDFGYSNVIHWISIFYFAGYCAYFHSQRIENISENPKVPKIVLVLIALCLFLIQSFVLNWLFAPLCWACLMFLMPKVPTANFMKNSFFMFCTHYFAVLTIRKVLFILFGASEFSMFMCYILTAVIAITLLCIIGSCFRKLFPKIFSFVCGGR